MSILTALSTAIQQRNRRLDREAPSRRHRALKNVILRCPDLRCGGLGLPQLGSLSMRFIALIVSKSLRQRFLVTSSHTGGAGFDQNYVYIAAGLHRLDDGYRSACWLLCRPWCTNTVILCTEFPTLLTLATVLYKSCCTHACSLHLGPWLHSAVILCFVVLPTLKTLSSLDKESGPLLASFSQRL